MVNNHDRAKEGGVNMKKNYLRPPKSLKETMDLWHRMENGDVDALMKLSLARGVITREQYDTYKEIDAFCKEDPECE